MYAAGTPTTKATTHYGYYALCAPPGIMLSYTRLYDLLASVR